MGWDDDTSHYFARLFENHGFYRRYDLTVDDKVRARIEFSDDGKQQTIT